MTDPISMNTTVLAWLGDAVYEVHVRERIVKMGLIHADELHAAAVGFVRASSQGDFMRGVIDGLPEDEKALAKRARNHKISTKPKNADPVDYKWATAFEALLGYYCLSGQQEKLTALIDRAMDQTGGTDNEQS